MSESADTEAPWSPEAFKATWKTDPHEDPVAAGDTELIRLRAIETTALRLLAAIENTGFDYEQHYDGNQTRADAETRAAYEALKSATGYVEPRYF